jgi:hypothetical protein
MHLTTVRDHDAAAHDGAILRTLRTLLLAVLTLGLAGTGLDLLLLAHYEDAWQIPPLVIIAMALVAVAWVWRNGGATAVTSLRIVMVLSIAAGLAGILLHYNGNRDFQLEMDPALGGLALLAKVVTAKAPPALAPAVMIQLGILGLIYTYRHPALTETSLRESEGTGAQV